MTYDYARLAKIKCFLFDMDGTINRQRTDSRYGGLF